MPVGADVVAATTMVLPRGVNAICEFVDMSDSFGSLGCLICAHHSRRMRCSTYGLHTGVLLAVVIARGNNVAVERATDLLAKMDIKIAVLEEKVKSLFEIFNRKDK